MPDNFGPDQAPSYDNLDEGAAQAVGTMNQYLYNRAGRAAKDQEEMAKTEMVTNHTAGTTTLTAPTDLIMQKMDASSKYDQISAIYMKQVQELEAQRAYIKAHPFANTLAQIAGSMAANDVNPVTRGLGQAAQRLNPSDAELQAREQVPLAGARETQTAKQGALTAIERTDLERSRYGEAIIQKGAQLYEKQLERLDLAIRQVSKTGEKVPRGVVEAMAKSMEITDPKVIDAALKKQEGMATASRSLQERTQEEKKDIVHERGEENRKTEEVRARNRYALADHNHEIGLEGRKAFEDYRTKILQARDLEVVPKDTKKKLVNLRETDRYLDGMQALLDDPKFGSLMGGEKLGRYMTRRLTTEDRVKLENYLKHETPRILNLVLRGGQGGASLLRTEEGRDMVRKLGVMTDLTVGQAKQVLGNIRQVVSQSRKSEMDGTPLAPWESYPDLLGPDKDYRPGGGGGPSLSGYQKWKAEQGDAK